MQTKGVMLTIVQIEIAIQRCAILLFNIPTLIYVFSGTAQSVGCTVDGDHPHSVIEEIDDGEREIPEVKDNQSVYTNFKCVG